MMGLDQSLGFKFSDEKWGGSMTELDQLLWLVVQSRMKLD
jgi:hypothetical protein